MKKLAALSVLLLSCAPLHHLQKFFPLLQDADVLVQGFHDECFISKHGIVVDAIPPALCPNKEQFEKETQIVLDRTGISEDVIFGSAMTYYAHNFICGGQLAMGCTTEPNISIVNSNEGWDVVRHEELHMLLWQNPKASANHAAHDADGDHRDCWLWKFVANRDYCEERMKAPDMPSMHY